MSFLRFTFIDLMDILMVAFIIFLLFRWSRGSSSIYIIVAILLVLLLQIIATALGMKMISSIIGVIIDVGAIGIVILFQPEIRRFLGTLGREVGNGVTQRKWLNKIFKFNNLTAVNTESATEIAEACMEMSEQKTGALIVLLKNDSLIDIIQTGDTIDSKIGRRLIMNIFYKNSPLHDGAMIIGKNRIVAARCTLPITQRTDLPARYGMRHKAAVGISEQSDASIIVVSEQTGKISFIRGGKIEPVSNISKLTLLLGEQISNDTKAVRE